MAKFTSGVNAGVDMLTFDIVDLGDVGEPTVFTSTTYKLEDTLNGSFNEFHGTGFTYNVDKDLIGGTLNEFILNDPATVGEILRVSNFSMPVPTVLGFLDSKNSQGFLAAIFAGNDSLTGSPLDDRLLGYNGNDTIDGGSGIDTLLGAAGNDSLIGGLGDDSLDGDAGNDKLVGGVGDDSLSGGADNDTLDGGDGNDSLDGGKGKDSMAGGKGDDLYFVDDAGDKVSETLPLATGGLDTVNSSVSFTLGLNLDNLVLTGTDSVSGTGNADKNAITGNDGDNKLSGLANNDTLDGGKGKDTLDGGTGDDSLVGGADDDLYVQDSAGDQIDESGTTLGDELRTNQLLPLGVVTNIEHYTFTGSKAVSFSGNAADNRITGTALADTLAGDVGNDTLNGLAGNDKLEGGDGNDRLDGGAGIDKMVGGTGDDTYVVDNAADVVDEAAGDANDTVESTFAIDLGLLKFQEIEHATLLGAGAINATGDGGNNKLTGNSGANKLDGLGGDDTMDGGKGADTYFVDVSTDQVSETLTLAQGGGIDTVIVDKTATGTFTLGANIDNLTLQGTNDVNATGNDLANVIAGNDGKNVIDGKGGIDKMSGGKGDDTYIVDDSKDTVTETVPLAAGGTDLVMSSVGFTLGANLENLELTGGGKADGTGNTLDNKLTGNDQDNKLLGLGGKDALIGNDGNDTLDGGAGDDTMTGGKGNDVYVLDSLNDKFVEAAGEGSDTVAATFKINLNDALYDDIENAALLGTAVEAIGDGDANILAGNASGNKLSGNGANDSLLGGGGNDTLDGGEGDDSLDGGAGSDSMEGGKGNDVFFVDSAADKLSDSAGDKDEVRTSLTYSLATLGFIENAMLLGVAAINLTGNGLDNLLTGNDGANKLDGGAGDDTLVGGLGNDTLTGSAGGADDLLGGKGNDIYNPDADDAITETADEGIDLVQAAFSYSLAPWDNVENLTLTGTAAIDGTGNAGKNVISGNAGANKLDGGAGTDTLVGGGGDDSYVVDDSGDKITEAAGGGTDTVFSSAAKFALPDNVEHLTLTGGGNIEGTGNTLPNKLTGNGGNNILSGLGGNDSLDGAAGTDTLNGGLGTDTYLYDVTKNGIDAVNTGDNGLDRVSLVGDDLFDWITKRDGNDLLISAIVDEADADAELDPANAIRIVNQYAGAGIAFFTGDFGEDSNLFYGADKNLTTVFTPTGLTGKDQGTNAEVIEGTDGNDTINGNGGQTDFLSGNKGNDAINSQSDVNEFGFLYGGEGNDTLTGSKGRDNLRGDEGDDLLNGGDGNDRADYRGADEGVTVDLNKQGIAQVISIGQGSDTLISIEYVRGGSFNDTLIGNDVGNTLNGRDGDDILTGNGGGDFLIGGKGNDTLDGGSLDDFDEASYEDADEGVIVNLTNSTQAGVAAHSAKDGLGGVDSLINIAGVFGSEFGDQVFGADNDEFFEPMGGDDTVDGGGGFDEIDFFSSTDAVTASLLLQGGAQFISTSQGTDTYTNFEGLDGGAFNDTLTGDENGNFLQGRGGTDSLQGGDGDDRLRGGAGNDTIDGGAGFDQADYLFATTAVRVDLTRQGVAQSISAGEGSDFLFGIEDVRGSNFNDTLIGDGQFNTLTGRDGNDSLNGGGGFDILIGGAGNDILNGGSLTTGNAVSYVDAPAGIFANLSGSVQSGVAVNTVSDGFGSTDKVSNVNGIIGSESNDTMIGGNLDDFFEGMGGNDFIDGGAGFNILEYFDSTDGVSVNLGQQGIAQLISASQGTDTFVNVIDVYGSFFNDTLTGDGRDNVLVGRGGDDRLVILNSLFLAADGGDGNDRLVVNSSFVTITQQDVFDKLFGIEEIDLTGTGANSVTLNALDVLQTSDTGTMRILGNVGDTVTSLGQGWVQGSNQIIDGQTYATYTFNQVGSPATLLVDTDITRFIS